MSINGPTAFNGDRKSSVESLQGGNVENQIPFAKFHEYCLLLNDGPHLHVFYFDFASHRVNLVAVLSLSVVNSGLSNNEAPGATRNQC